MELCKTCKRKEKHDEFLERICQNLTEELIPKQIKIIGISILEELNLEKGKKTKFKNGSCKILLALTASEMITNTRIKISNCPSYLKEY